MPVSFLSYITAVYEYKLNSNSDYLVPHGKFRKPPQAEQRAAEGAFLVRALNEANKQDKQGQ